MKRRAVGQARAGVQGGIDSPEDGERHVDAGQHALGLGHHDGARLELRRDERVAGGIADGQVLGQRAVDERFDLGRYVEHATAVYTTASILSSATRANPAVSSSTAMGFTTTPSSRPSSTQDR